MRQSPALSKFVLNFRYLVRFRTQRQLGSKIKVFRTFCFIKLRDGYMGEMSE